MSVSELKKQVALLNLDERRELAAYLVSIRHKEMMSYQEELAEKINDDSSENWVSLEEFDKRIGA